MLSPTDNECYSDRTSHQTHLNTYFGQHQFHSQITTTITSQDPSISEIQTIHTVHITQSIPLFGYNYIKYVQHNIYTHPQQGYRQKPNLNKPNFYQKERGNNHLLHRSANYSFRVHTHLQHVSYMTSTFQQLDLNYKFNCQETIRNHKRDNNESLVYQNGSNRTWSDATRRCHIIRHMGWHHTSISDNIATANYNLNTQLILSRFDCYTFLNSPSQMVFDSKYNRYNNQSMP